MEKKSLVNVLGVVYSHIRSHDGGDLYLTRYAEKYQKHFDVRNWFEPEWFRKHRIKLKGTSAVYRVPTKEIDGRSFDLVVKYCRVGEDVPLDTHTLEEFCDAEFNSPWEEFSLVMEMEAGHYGPKDLKINTQHPMGIYVPPEKMQLWQSGRSREKINRIRARHPGIDLDILKQYILIYQWIEGYNLTEVFDHIRVDADERVQHLKSLDGIATLDLQQKGYLVADTKPEHIIIRENDTDRIWEFGKSPSDETSKEQLSHLHHLLNSGHYSVVDYELLLRTPEHEAEVKDLKRHSYLDNLTHRFVPTPLPDHLSSMEIFGVPYVYGHSESTGGHLWVVGNNAMLFDYFLPERWRKTPAIQLSHSKDVFYTVTKDGIHLVWEISSVGEIPDEADEEYRRRIIESGINSPFEEFAIAHRLNELGIPCVYVRAIYMTGTSKMETSSDRRKYDSHSDILDPEGNPILQEVHNYITIRGYYNGPDTWVAEQKGPLYVPVDLARGIDKGIIDESLSLKLLERTKESLRSAGYDGELLKPDDLLLSINSRNEIVKDDEGSPFVVICNFENIWKKSDARVA
jgi:hypothetical protein